MRTSNMKAIFINAKEGKVTYVNNKGSLEEIYQTMNVEMIEIGCRWDNGDFLYVDEEGLLNGTDYGFEINGKYFVGNGLIYGTDIYNPGASGSAVSKIEDYKFKFFKLPPVGYL